MQTREQSDRDPHVTMAADPMANKRHSLFAARSQAVILLKDITWNFLSELFYSSATGRAS
jgi:hypothetical protein